MVNKDWEKAKDKDTIYAVERQKLIEQEFYSFRKTAKITYKKHGNKNIAITLPRIDEKVI